MKRSEEFYEGDRDIVLSTAGRGETMQEVLDRRRSRRTMVKGAAGAGLMLTLGAPAFAKARQATPAATPEASPAATPVAVAAPFEPIALDEGDDMLVAAGHVAVPFLRWGDPVVAGAPEWDIANQTAASQERQVGYNCDWIGFFPLPAGSATADHGLLVVNHEYTNPELMFPGYLTPNPDYNPDDEESAEFLSNPTRDIVDVELAAHGLTVIEIRRTADGTWEPVLDSTYNRRITATTPVEVTGPAAGIDLLKTGEDATGTQVTGTLNNCAGGSTPWGTVLTGEENFQQYFGENQHPW
jgi:uncharacterized protein